VRVLVHLARRDLISLVAPDPSAEEPDS
jgi:hypothetical protein